MRGKALRHVECARASKLRLLRSCVRQVREGRAGEVLTVLHEGSNTLEGQNVQEGEWIGYREVLRSCWFRVNEALKPDDLVVFRSSEGKRAKK